MAIFGQGGPRGTSGLRVSVDNLATLRAAMSEIERGMKTPANKFMREASYDIAEKILAPELRKTAAASPLIISRRFADTINPVRDRLVTVQIGGKYAKLSGLKRNVGDVKAAGGGRYGRNGTRLRTTRNYNTTLAWASEFGPYAGAPINYYGVPRNERGYWVQPAIRNVLDETKKRWNDAIQQMARRYSRFR